MQNGCALRRKYRPREAMLRFRMAMLRMAICAYTIYVAIVYFSDFKTSHLVGWRNRKLYHRNIWMITNGNQTSSILPKWLTSRILHVLGSDALVLDGTANSRRVERVFKGRPEARMTCEECNSDFGVLPIGIVQPYHSLFACPATFERSKSTMTTEPDRIRSLLGAPCIHCGKVVKDHLFEIHQLHHTLNISMKEYPCECPICFSVNVTRICKNTRDYTQHLRAHFAYFPYQCPKCSMRFTMMGLYKSHLVSHKTCVCPRCGKELSSPRWLRYHLEPKLKKRTHLKKALVEAGIDPNSIADCEFEEPRELSRPRSRRCA
ncbi:hypothetical protein AAMO2058_000531000 [Amorphochlora amoebiformis]